MRRHYSMRKALGWALAALVLALNYTPPVRTLASLPSTIQIIEGQTQRLNLGLPLTGALSQQGVTAAASLDQTLGDLSITGDDVGTAQLSLRLMGVIPIKSVAVAVQQEKVVIPGGHSIGVALKTQGVLVVGMSDLAGSIASPARVAGLRAGDTITRVDNQDVTGAAHLSTLVDDERGDQVVLSVVRKGREFKLQVVPALDANDDVYRLGVWVRDSTAGVGTLSFYDPVSTAFGALGHPVTDSDTGELLGVREGEIYHSSVVNVRQGQRGDPGELMGDFLGEALSLGNITLNNSYGIYGVSESQITNPLYPQGIKIATRAMVKTGPAKILATVGGDQIREYDCEITRASTQDSPGPRSMVVRVTDAELLSKTGGIVQGMSGSPIIQDGRLVGAITHVFVNDPTQGYGLYIEWMLSQESEALSSSKS